MKKVMKKLLLFILSFFVSLSFLCALPSLSQSFSAENLLLLQQKEVLAGSTLKSGISDLMPSFSLIRQRAEEAEKEDNSFTVALTAFVEYPESWKALSTEEKQLKLLNIMTSLSTQKGITYISRNAGYKEKTLIEESYSISDPENKKTQIADAVFQEVPGQLTLYSYQKDNRFGGNIFSVDYKTAENEIFMKINNLTKMKFMGVTCIKENNLCMNMDAYMTEEGLVISALATVYDRKPSFTVLFYKVDIEDSFNRRITGLKNWFVQQLQ